MPSPADSHVQSRRPLAGSSRHPATQAPRDSRTAPPRSPRRPRTNVRAYHRTAERRLRRLRQGSALAVAIVALLLLVGGAPVDGEIQPAGEHAAGPQGNDGGTDRQALSATEGVDEAADTLLELAYGFYAYLPRLLLVLFILGLAALVAKLARAVLERSLRGWERTAALTAITRLVVFLVATVAAVSILAGDVRAVVGSVGLLGLAASWALQTPIESFTGWLLNSFRGYYRVGDQIAVGDVFGDVYRIDILTTTVWEAGGSGKPVAAAQATGALITFPNWEVLRTNIVNYSRDFPYVWDEVTVGVANESDLGYCAEVLQATARRVLGDQMEPAANQYEQLLKREHLLFDVDEVPRVYFSTTDSWTNCTIRYVVPVRSRRKWSSDLLLEISRELARPEHRGRIISVYPRTEVVLRQGWTRSEPEAAGGPPPRSAANTATTAEGEGEE